MNIDESDPKDPSEALFKKASIIVYANYQVFMTAINTIFSMKVIEARKWRIVFGAMSISGTMIAYYLTLSALGLGL